MAKDRTLARKLAAESMASGDAASWHDRLYAMAQGSDDIIPWANMVPNPNLTQLLSDRNVEGGGEKALVVGCGLGDDAEELVRRGFKVTGFDISPTAIEWCKRRFPGTTVSYVVADLFNVPKDWIGGFDFVLESYTLQVLPHDLRVKAMECIASVVAPVGTLVVIARGRDDHDPKGDLPWPVTRSELEEFSRRGLKEAAFDDYVDNEQPPVRRFRAVYSGRGGKTD